MSKQPPVKPPAKIDPMTRAKDMVRYKNGDEAAGILPCSDEQIAKMWGVSISVVKLSTDPVRGLVALSGAWQRALKSGHVSLLNARHVGRLLPDLAVDRRHPLMDQVLDHLLKTKGKKPHPDRSLSAALVRAVNAQGAVPSAQIVAPPAWFSISRRNLLDIAAGLSELGRDLGPAHARKNRYAVDVLKYLGDGSGALDEAARAKIAAVLGARKRGRPSS